METFITTAAGKPTIAKDPAAVLDYVVDWTAWLAVVSDTIASAVAVGTGVVVDSVQVMAGGQKVLVWVSGGVANVTGSVAVKITTASLPPRIDERTIWFKVRDR